MYRLAPFAIALTTVACAPILEPIERPSGGADTALSDTGEREQAVNEADEAASCAWADELGDAIEDAPNLGLLETPGEICGELDEVDNDVDGYAGDLDFVAFQVAWDATYHLALSWSAEADYDLYLFELTDEGYETLADNYVEGTEYESLVIELEAGVTYVVGVAGWEGSAGDWILTIE